MESFEESLKRLEDIISELEKGNLPLEKSIERYQEGVDRLKKCYNMLDEIEKKVVLISRKSDGSIEEIPFKFEKEKK